MEFLDINDGLMINMEKIISIRIEDGFNSIITVDHGSGYKEYVKNIPFETLKKVVLGRIGDKGEKYLEQIAKYQQSFVG